MVVTYLANCSRLKDFKKDVCSLRPIVYMHANNKLNRIDYVCFVTHVVFISGKYNVCVKTSKIIWMQFGEHFVLNISLFWQGK